MLQLLFFIAYLSSSPSSLPWCNSPEAELLCYLKSEITAPLGNRECWRIDESYIVLRCCEYPETREMWCTSIQDPCNTWESEEWQRDDY